MKIRLAPLLTLLVVSSAANGDGEECELLGYGEALRCPSCKHFEDIVADQGQSPGLYCQTLQRSLWCIRSEAVTIEAIYASKVGNTRHVSPASFPLNHRSHASLKHPMYVYTTANCRWQRTDPPTTLVQASDHTT